MVLERAWVVALVPVLAPERWLSVVLEAAVWLVERSAAVLEAA